MSQITEKRPLGHKSYGHIPHLSGSRLGPGDHKIEPGMESIATVKTRDRHDLVIVQEKLDGSNCAVAKINGQIIALTRAGYTALSSPYSQHHYFDTWVRQNKDRFDAFLSEGERVVGEWLLQAHGTRYNLYHEPFVVFDIMKDGHKRLTVDAMQARVAPYGFVMPNLLHCGPAISIERVINLLGLYSGHGAIDTIEGAVWRIERKGEVDFLCKYVRQDKIDGYYLESQNGTGEPVYNISPDELLNI